MRRFVRRGCHPLPWKTEMNQPIRFSTPDETSPSAGPPEGAVMSEELARAEVYGLLSQLFYAPPGAELYAQLRVAPTVAPAASGFLESSWTDVVAAARRLDPGQVADEYAALFQGIGKPEVFLYGSHHLAGALNETPLVALR